MISSFDATLLPEGVVISVISIVFKLTTEVLHLARIQESFPLCSRGKNFLNSVACSVAVKGKTEPVHLKLFKNGSGMGAGFKTVPQISEALTTLVETLAKEESYADTALKEVSITTINCVFRFPHGIRLEKLFSFLLDDQETYIDCSLDKMKHAALRIRMTVEDKKKPVGIFLFRSGCVMIAGALTHSHIISAHNLTHAFVTKYPTILLPPKQDDGLGSL